ncbi:1-pyrroline-5-carboxylate dehydrogenase [Streptomyces rubellomurinus subsp. indigoferus]|uniref:L-glutamate gamma-semialdehyde dehydrogenase n=1 Tax=Streptomyces rubellomurinus (strain ATCC 31215) TaxID=359131 RepID=A0A0F2T980_STRR3|nr:L-glutamate gamma-semialdehyde dehydrogenase [Streptomyces rubellomurinus]KJS53416.1 1-pyrroline-5-carboxylate dehydrogenase [Streptomyces rubellomurinus subsp. indigoferus]KJS58880.1 1-pyrroline-5-carboxylate dehydrogenase [Streptomyces rubellomurinus]
MDAVTQVPAPVNEPVHSYAPGSPERARLEAKLKELGGQEPVQLTMTINGERRMGGGTEIHVVQPHNHAARLGTLRNATQADAQDAIDAALAAAPAWQALSFDSRAAIFLKAADLLAGPWRETLAAATMLGQSKTAQQAEIDTPCELVDFLRFNVHFARQIMAEQPISSDGVWNRSDHRPLEGFVYAITPFNFTAIAGNLPTAPALMGNVVLWKPSPTQQYSAHLLMQLLEEAGLPKGVINMVTGDGLDVSAVALKHPALAGIHFTGSTATFQHLWREVGNNIAGYRTYPRIVGETGGKDFLVAHPSADPAVLKTAMTRGAFEFQGQKCSALSRAYVPASLWAGLKDEFAAEVDGLTMGDVTDLSNFMSAVIDERAFAKNKAAIDRARADASVEVIAGGTYDDSVGYFVRPTVLVCQDPASEYFRDEYFGPILAVYVYEDEKYEEMLAQMESVSAYGLTGSIISQDRAAAQDAMHKLRFAAGNFYINDKPTGAVVGQQPFGGGRASGTNDKAGAKQNLARWTSTRSVKETFVPPTDYRYPHMG